MQKFSLPSKPILPIYFTAICAVLFIFGIAIIERYEVFAVILMIFSLFVAFLRYGNQFDKEKQRYREYTGLLGLKWGKWKSLDDYSCIIVLHNRKVSISYKGATIKSGHDGQVFSSINLSNSSHLKKEVVFYTRNAKRARLNAKRLSDYLDIPYQVV